VTVRETYREKFGGAGGVAPVGVAAFSVPPSLLPFDDDPFERFRVGR
jgi:hypothetical protein